MDKIIVYAAQYSECVYESAFATISIHKTRSGAENAIKLHKKTIYDMYKENYAWQKENYPDEYNSTEFSIPSWEQWNIRELEILE